MPKTFFLWILLLIIFGAGGWYFFLKPEDYNVSFNTSAPPGRVYQKLVSWKFKNLGKNRVLKQKAFNQVKHIGELKDAPLELEWNISALNDSVTRVKIRVDHTENKLFNRLKLLISKPDFQEKTKEDILQFKEALEADSELFKVQLTRSEEIPATTCACISLESPVEEKAFEMMKNIDTLSNYLLNYNLEMEARPRVHVTSWNKESNSIAFDFCFPLKGEKNNFPETQRIFIKEIPSQRGLKAVFNGNYMFSHQAWFRLVNYAENNNLELKNEILEIFNDNPEMGGDAKNWEAEIYIPLKK